MWSTSKPTEAGYYWFRLDADDVEPHITEVSWNYTDYSAGKGDLHVYETGGGCFLLSAYDDGEWQPVTAPV